MVYFIPLILILIGIYKHDYLKRRHGKFIILFLIGISLILIAGFRYRLGADTIFYSQYFHKLPPLADLSVKDFENTRFAPGFVIFTSFCKTISHDIIFFQILESFIVTFSVFFFFWKNTKNIFTAILFYYCVLYTDLNMEVMREALAVSIFLLAWPTLKNGNWFIYLLLILLASTFHISAIPFLFLPLIFLPGINYFFTFGKRTLIICGLVLIISIGVRYLFLDFIKAIAVTESMMERATAYSKDNMGGNETLNIFGGIRQIIIYVLYPILAIYFINKKLNANLKLESLSILGMYIGTSSIAILILIRYNNYLMFSSFALLADWIFSNIKINYKKIKLDFIGWICIIIPYFFFASYTQYNAPLSKNLSVKTYRKYYPYNSVFDREKDQQREKAIHH